MQLQRRELAAAAAAAGETRVRRLLCAAGSFFRLTMDNRDAMTSPGHSLLIKRRPAYSIIIT
jgi:hypothetical protein